MNYVVDKLAFAAAMTLIRSGSPFALRSGREVVLVDLKYLQDIKEALGEINLAEVSELTKDRVTYNKKLSLKRWDS